MSTGAISASHTDQMHLVHNLLSLAPAHSMIRYHLADILDANVACRHHDLSALAD